MSTFTHTIAARVVLDDGSVIALDYSAEITPVYFMAQGQINNPSDTITAAQFDQWDVLALKSIGSYGTARIEDDNSGVFTLFGFLQNMFVMHTNRMSVGDNSLTAPADVVNYIDLDAPGIPDYAKWSFLTLNTTAS